MEKKEDVLKFIRGGIRCFDGATGTMLFKLGYEGKGAPENVDAEITRKVHEAYASAGAEFLTTNTFGGTSLKLANYNLQGSAYKLNRRNATIARKVCGGNCYVAGDVGPTGQFLKPYGSLDYEELYSTFKEQVAGLVEGGADLILIETMQSKEEVIAAIKAAKNGCSLPVFACVTFEKRPKGFLTLMGVSVESAVKAMTDAGADVVGTNCTLNPIDMPALVEEFTKHTELPIIAQPNAGQPKAKNGKIFYEEIPEAERYMRALIEAGASIVGGCCGTDPDYIRRLRKIVDEYNSKK
jgi:5-methyltetrahydrofolate--homocysteine methyltransferase